MDGDFGRTAVLQFTGSFAASPVDDAAPPATVALGNHPNPFNPATTITYDLPRALQVDLTIYSPDGRRICRLVQGERGAGTHRVLWDGTDRQGRSVPSGVYLARIATAEGTVSHKVVVAK